MMLPCDHKWTILVDQTCAFENTKLIRTCVYLKNIEMGGKKYAVPMAAIGEGRFLLAPGTVVNKKFDFYAIAQVPAEYYGEDGGLYWRWDVGFRIYKNKLLNMGLASYLKKLEVK